MANKTVRIIGPTGANGQFKRVQILSAPTGPTGTYPTWLQAPTGATGFPTVIGITGAVRGINEIAIVIGYTGPR